ncbi:MAG: BTAD domain-containing putative transcriptional regulator [Gaiellales bacterium]
MVEHEAVHEFRILGPLEVSHEDGVVPLGGPKQRALLALLLLYAGEVVSTDRLIDALWGERPPRTAATSLQNFVSQLRKLFGADVVLTRAPGYGIRLEPDQLDVDLFRRLVGEARSAEPGERARMLREALALWRGPALADLAYEAFAASEIERLEELRLGTVEELMDADLELGSHNDVVGELEALVRAHPTRERLRGQLMLALYRSGRQAEALETYHAARRALADELGISPGPALQQLYRSILRQEANLAPGAPGPPVSDHYDEVLSVFLAGRLVPVLGGVANRCGRPDERAWDEAAYLPDDNEVAAHLARRFGYPADNPIELPRVAQFAAATKGVGPLYDELHELFDRDYEPGPVHRSLAALVGLARERDGPFPVVVTSGYDCALERVLADEGHEYDVVSYIAFGRERGKFLHSTSNGSSTVIDVPNAYTDVIPDRRTVILKIHGHVDRSHARERDSFAAMEDDYIDYLAATDVSSVLPVTLAARLHRSHFLFLGYRFTDWYLRVFLHRVWRHEKVAYRSWAVAPHPDAIERELWRQSGIDIFELPLEEYVERLRARAVELALEGPL